MVPTSIAAERHLRALGLARQCAALGARVRTIAVLTGLPNSLLNQLFFADRTAVQRGRAPDSPDWYYTANLINRTEASIFMSIYRRIRELGFDPVAALVSGYRHYLSVCVNTARISFDRAFDLASHLDGIWRVRVPSFSLMTCPACASQFAASLSVLPAAQQDCPFCKLVSRYPHDRRIQASFPACALPDLAALRQDATALSRHFKEG